jgi:catechol 2,3-dioxygenase-like lactoylglutathione lyase family enzyme
MKRVHIHVSTRDLAASRRFYSALLGAEPMLERADYLKWSLDDPPLNLAVSNFGHPPGVDHLGIEVERDVDVPEAEHRLTAAAQVTEPEPDVACCYHRSTKVWASDPQAVAWECFCSHGLAPRPEAVPMASQAGPFCAAEVSDSAGGASPGCCA